MVKEVIHSQQDFEPVLVLPVTALPSRTGKRGGKRYGLVLDGETIETVAATVLVLLDEWTRSFESRRQ